MKYELRREKEPPYPRRHVPNKSTRLGEVRWPLPNPLPIYPAEDVAKTLQQILMRLDRIENCLENIERLLLQRESTP